MDYAKELILAAILFALALAVGIWWGVLGWTLFVGLSIWVGVQCLEYRKVALWARRPLRRPSNGSDFWFALAYRPFRSLNRERQRTRNVVARLREVLTLVEGMPDAVVILAPTGEIEGFNTAARDLLELTDADVGLGLATVVRSPDFVEFLRMDVNDDPLEFISPFDPERNFEARRFNVDTGRTVVMVRDITTLNRLLTMRQNFVANVSHELRTPVTVVAGYLETILDEDQPADLRLELTKRFSGPLRRMQSLVDDLLLLTRLESTAAPEHQDVLAMPRVIDAALAEVQNLLSRPDQVTVEINTDKRILGVETELHSVCTNLIANALRYSPDGGDVIVSWSDLGDKVRLAVADSGVGIAPEHIDRLTERFYRVDLAGARSRGGTGLGLAIVKHVLRRHDSELQVESTLGAGSLFYCDFYPSSDPASDPASDDPSAEALNSSQSKP
jgi:two-component system phosphate regulon sensor histidine kinase PhoR